MTPTPTSPEQNLFTTAPQSPIEGLPELPADVARATPPEVRELYEAVRAELTHLQVRTHRQNSLASPVHESAPLSPVQESGEGPEPLPNDQVRLDPVAEAHKTYMAERDIPYPSVEDQLDGPAVEGSAPARSTIARRRNRPALTIQLPNLDDFLGPPSARGNKPNCRGLYSYLNVRSPTQSEWGQVQEWLNSPNTTADFTEWIQGLPRAPTRPEMRYALEHPAFEHLTPAQTLVYLSQFIYGMEQLCIQQRYDYRLCLWTQLHPFAGPNHPDRPRRPFAEIRETARELRDRLLEETGASYGTDPDNALGIRDAVGQGRDNWHAWVIHRRGGGCSNCITPMEEGQMTVEEALREQEAILQTQPTAGAEDETLQTQVADAEMADERSSNLATNW